MGGRFQSLSLGKLQITKFKKYIGIQRPVEPHQAYQLMCNDSLKKRGEKR